KEMGKTVQTIVKFPACGTFGAINKAEEQVQSLGYSKGSMCRDEPIALVKGDCHIAKWYNISQSEYNRIDGLLISKDFREGAVTLYIFN
ncbi:MAG: hypothetical protein RLY43_2151, partial [Bacteroidota bacterium]